jgi:hypothetical protein
MTLAPPMARVMAWVATLLSVVQAGGAVRRPSVDETIAGLRRLAVEWSVAGRSDAELLPFVRADESGGGVEQMSRAIAECCRGDGLCPWVAPRESGVDAVGATVCDFSWDKVNRIADQLVASVAPSGSVVLERLPEQARPRFARSEHRWTGSAGPMMLSVMSSEESAFSFALVSIERCVPSTRVQTRSFKSGRSVRHRLDLKDQTEGTRVEDGELWFPYLTACRAYDEACVRAEVAGLWPDVRSDAERQGLRSVTVRAEEDCRFGYSTHYTFDRQAEGTWSDPFDETKVPCTP